MSKFSEYIRKIAAERFEDAKNTSDEKYYTKFMRLWDSFEVILEGYTRKATLPQCLESFSREFAKDFEYFAQRNELYEFYKYIFNRDIESISWVKGGVINIKVFQDYYQDGDWVYLISDSMKECVRISGKRYILVQQYYFPKNFNSFVFVLYQVRKNLFLEDESNPVENMEELVKASNMVLEEFLKFLYSHYEIV